MKTPRTLVLSAACCAMFALAPHAHAGGYATARFGGEHGNPASDHTTSVYYNPAGLALGKGTNVYVEGLLVYRKASYERPEGAIGDVDGGTPNDAEAIAANSGKATLSNILASPFIGMSTKVGDNLGIGLALYAPFGGQASWGTQGQFTGGTYPGADDGAQRWHAIDGYHRVVHVTLAAAYKLPGRLSVGVGFNLVNQNISTLRARNTDGTDDLITPSGQPKEGRSLFEGSQLSYSIGGGLMWEADDKTRIGLSYQSQPGFGESALEGDLTTQVGANLPAAPIPSVLLFNLPDIFRAGVTYRVSPTLEVRASGDFTRWSKFKRHCALAAVDDPVCDINPDGSNNDGTVDGDGSNATVLLAVPRNWKDTFGVRAGASYWLVKGMELFGGLGYDSNAVPDETLEAGLVDMDKIVTSAGVRMGLMDDRLLLTGSFTNVFYLSREIAVRDPADAPLTPSLSPDAAGKYSQSVNFLTFGAQYAF